MAGKNVSRCLFGKDPKTTINNILEAPIPSTIMVNKSGGAVDLGVYPLNPSDVFKENNPHVLRSIKDGSEQNFSLEEVRAVYYDSHFSKGTLGSDHYVQFCNKELQGILNPQKISGNYPA